MRSDGPRRRDAVRVLLIDERQRVLLLGGIHPGTGAAFWFAPGGAPEEGEGPRAAAIREVAEETGLADAPLGPEIWRRRHTYSWRGVEWDQRERWFAARVAGFEPDHAGMGEAERAEISDCRWWSIAELESTTDELIPPNLAKLLGEVLDGEGAA